jgi:hypothetical protein
MKRTILTVAMLTLTVLASADVRLFFTTSADPYGLDNGAWALTPTSGTHRDYSDGYYTVAPARFPPVQIPPPEPQVWCSNGDWAYLWLRFEGEPKNAKINGLMVALSGLAPTNLAYYLCDDTDGVGLKRWDGVATPPDYPEFRQNPQTLVAVTDHGLVNNSFDEPYNLYQGTSHTVPLGAFTFGDQVGQITGQITNINYASGATPTVVGGSAWINIPEPVSAGLLALLLLLRRRAYCHPTVSRL